MTYPTTLSAVIGVSSSADESAFTKKVFLKRSTRAVVGVLGFGLCLTSCAKGGFDGLEGANATASVCPPLIEYEASFTEIVAHELDLLPKNSATKVMLEDYAHVRDFTRSCVEHLSD